MSKYDESSIQVFKELEGVRVRPTMYIGELGSKGVIHILREIVENSVDEFMDKNNSYIVVKVEETDKGQIFFVGDKGRGIPVGTHKKTGISTLTTIFTTLHAGGKFDANSYKYMRGTHGVGASVTNALSAKFEVWTFREGCWYYQWFVRGKPKSVILRLKKVPSEARMLGLKEGTIIKFIPDYSILSNNKIVKASYSLLHDWLYDIAFLNSGIKIRLITPKEDELFYNSGGPAEFVSQLVGEGSKIGKCFVHDTDNLSVAFQWTESDSEEELFSYVSGALTSDGGSHYSGLSEAILQAFKEYSTKTNGLTSQDLKVGLIGFINYRMQGGEFDSQKKDKLITPGAKKEVYTQIVKSLLRWLNKHNTTAKLVLNRALELKNARVMARELAKAASKVKIVKSKVLLPGKLMTATTKFPEEKELFLIEGDSVGGSAEKARYSRFQEVLALKGKPQNAAKATLLKTLQNKEVQDILMSVGINLKKIKDKSSYRIGKVIFCGDPDIDGYHITTLLATLLQIIAPDLYDKGMVYDVDAPLYFASYKDKKYYGYTLEEIQKKLPKNAPNHCITRAKGWGEAPWQVLRELAFEEKTRKLKKILPLTGKERHRFMSIVGEDSSIRKKLLGIK